ncbi:MAG: TRAP transporter small permease [Atribacterota bacterium]|nr:TRAP transporter small permease [Atribacterota bacterium]
MKKSNSKFVSNLTKIQGKILVLLLFVLTVTVFSQVVSRYILKVPFLWGQEVAIFCFSWIVIISSAIATVKDEHFKIEFILDKFSPKGRRIMNLINYTLMLIYSFLLLVKGWEYAIMGLKRASIYFEIAQFWTYISLFIAGFTMIIFLIPIILNELLLFRNDHPVLNQREKKTNESTDNFI